MFSWAFCDFGPEFEVVDSTGEEPKEFFIWNISKVCEGHIKPFTEKEGFFLHVLYVGQRKNFEFFP